MNKPDLNLLAVFDAVARLGSVTAAAQDLGLSQPAVSHALNRLRATLGDPLFTRSGRGLVQTPCAEAMVRPVRELLQMASGLLAPQSFCPDKDEAVFRIAASDYATLTVVPKLAKMIPRNAPFVALEIVPMGQDTFQKLESGILDMSFWGTQAPVKPLYYLHLFDEHYVGAARRDHPIFDTKNKGKIDLASYLAVPHAVVSMRDPGANQIEKALSILGVSRRVGLASHSFAGNIACLKNSDYIANLPSRLCQSGLADGLRVFRLPFEMPSYSYGFIWHHRTHTSPKHIWLREMIARAASEQEVASV